MRPPAVEGHSPGPRRLLWAAAGTLGGAVACASLIPAPTAVDSPPYARLAHLRAAGPAPIDPAAIDLDLLAAAVFAEANRRRQQEGARPLEHLAPLEAAASGHAHDMVAGGFFDHLNRLDPGKRTVADRVARAGLAGRLVAENIARTFALRIDLRRDGLRPAAARVYPLPAPGQFSLEPLGPPIPPHTYESFAADLVGSWMSSPAHRANLLSGQARSMGCGCRDEVDADGLVTLVCVQVVYAP